VGVFVEMETFCSSSVSALILEMDLFEETHSVCL
jgi:hypothetical protein